MLTKVCLCFHKTGSQTSILTVLTVASLNPGYFRRSAQPPFTIDFLLQLLEYLYRQDGEDATGAC